jgi:polyphosphate kinase
VAAPARARPSNRANPSSRPWRGDLLLYHPYQSFDPVVRLVEEAADDPDVLAIKQILYRTSENSPIVAALARAANRDKHVTVLVELKARFDEARNIGWAEALEQTGVQVIYGLKGLKTHAKICIIVRREPTGIRRYVHFGTGNYNEITARLYSDISYMTCQDDYGADATAFFNMITGYSQPVSFRKIEAAPLGLRAAPAGTDRGRDPAPPAGPARQIIVKVNSLVDEELIEALYRASAGRRQGTAATCAASAACGPACRA